MSNFKKTNILIIAPYYAPSSEVPSVRMVSLSNTLIKAGHSVTVLCFSRNQLLKLYDVSELRTEIPKGVKTVGFEIDAPKIPYVSDLILGKKFKALLSRLIDLKSYDVVLVTCGPYYTLEAMPLIKKSGVPYVLDFRDLGAINYRPHLRTEKQKDAFWKRPVKACYRALAMKREHKAVTDAAHVVCVSRIDRNKMQAAYHIPSEKLSIVTNGYDEDKLSTIKAAPKREGITGMVFGKFMYYSRERAVCILKAISNLRKEGIDICLMHIGRPYDWIQEAIDQNEIDPGSYCALGLKDYAEGMALLGAADFFLVEDTSPDDVGTKIYDYIFWNKPVVAAVPKNIPLANLVDSFEQGYACDTAVEIETAIREIVSKKYAVLDTAMDVNEYSRKHQNKIMMDVLQRVSGYWGAE